jgi:hypothetical protein
MEKINKEEGRNGSAKARRSDYGGGRSGPGAFQTADAGSRAVLPDSDLDGQSIAG